MQDIWWVKIGHKNISNKGILLASRSDLAKIHCRSILLDLHMEIQFFYKTPKIYNNFKKMFFLLSLSLSTISQWEATASNRKKMEL